MLLVMSEFFDDKCASKLISKRIPGWSEIARVFTGSVDVLVFCIP